jgi:DNA modification methylase/predicted RNA-binding Zn-ribbon protein involved in translation (DUF1610 family)
MMDNMKNNPELFQSTIVPAPDGSGKLFEERLDAPGKPVACLGKTFAGEEERRAYFTGELRKHLADPEFRKIEGFPIGKDEDILALSDPPYYTVCPNPWIADFIARWEKEKSTSDTPYHREPFAADVSEGKNDPIYNAHSYHTKVPHKAIMRYILHYTEPGDIVFDGFCGTGMTGVAAQMCGNKTEVESLGYRVEDDGTILQQETNENGEQAWKPFSRLGARRAVLNDLSPAAAFIAYSYNMPVDVAAFETEARCILAEVEAECGWMYETLHTDGKTKGKINYTVWSEVFNCPNCSKEVVFWEAAVDKAAGEVLHEFPCPYCGAMLTKRNMDRAWVNKFDTAIQQNIKQAKQVPVLINYSLNGKRYEKKPDTQDLAVIDKIENSEIPYWFPKDRMMEGGETRRNDPIGITHVHHFYTKRNMRILATIQKKVNSSLVSLILLDIFSVITKMSRFRVPAWIDKTTGPMKGGTSGTLYIPSLQGEQNVLNAFTEKYYMIARALKNKVENKNTVISSFSFSQLSYISDSIDYIFIDPPFGSNLNYSELNSLWEAWLRIKTNNKTEVIENSNQNKGKEEYRILITNCFKEAYRVLKPGHWMTVEFSNTQTSIWNIIQTSLAEAGFIIANVSALDKKQGSFKAVTTPTAVKQDLVISAYKPNGGFEQRFIKEADTPEGVWDFVRTHLKYLPVVKVSGENFQPIPERDPRILFDQVVAYYVRKNVAIPIASSQEFQAGLPQRFVERDGMYFLAEQVSEYDSKKIAMGNRIKSAELFVLDEATAIQWLRQTLQDKPQTFQQIHPHFMQEISGWNKNEKQLELSILLEQNFLKDNKDCWHVPDPENAAHIEQMREKALLKEFEEYKTAAKRLKTFRVEAVRAGFKKAYIDHDYETIIKTAAKLQGDVIEEDPKLLMYYSNAQTRLGGD